MEKTPQHRSSNTARNPEMEDNRKKALTAALGQIEKQFGKGSVMRLGDAAATYDVEAISTGSLVSTSHSALAACRAVASWRSTDLSRRAKRP